MEEVYKVEKDYWKDFCQDYIFFFLEQEYLKETYTVKLRFKSVPPQLYFEFATFSAPASAEKVRQIQMYYSDQIFHGLELNFYSYLSKLHL